MKKALESSREMAFLLGAEVILAMVQDAICQWHGNALLEAFCDINAEVHLRKLLLTIEKNVGIDQSQVQKVEKNTHFHHLLDQ